MIVLNMVRLDFVRRKIFFGCGIAIKVLVQSKETSFYNSEMFNLMEGVRRASDLIIALCTDLFGDEVLIDKYEASSSVEKRINSCFTVFFFW